MRLSLRRNEWKMGPILLGAVILCASCTAGEGGQTEQNEPDPVRMQLSWIPDAQAAGYLMAQEKGFYEEENLDVELLPGGPSVNVLQQVVTGAANFTVNKVSALFAARDSGLPLIAVAQFDQRSSFPLVAFKDSGIEGPQDFRGKKVGIWFDGDEIEFLALMGKVGIDPEKDLELFEQGFSIEPFLTREYDVSMVTSFSYLPLLYLEGVEPNELTVIDPSDYGITIPHGSLIVNEDWLNTDDHRDVAARFLRATLRGWDYAFENQNEAAEVAREAILTAGGETVTTQLSEFMRLQVAGMEALHFPEGFPRADHARIDEAMYRDIAGVVHEYELVEMPVDVPASYDADIWNMATDGD